MKRFYNPYIASVKNTIIETIAVQGVGSSFSMRRRITNKCGNRTAQAVSKALKELREAGQVVRVGHGAYVLNPAFLQEVLEFVSRALANCPLNVVEVIGCTD